MKAIVRKFNCNFFLSIALIVLLLFTSFGFVFAFIYPYFPPRNSFLRQTSLKMLTALSRGAKANNMVKASFLADAASMPLHWIYSQARVNELIGDSKNSAFFPTPSCPYYNYPFGSLSPYGDESLPVLKSLSMQSEGTFSAEHLAQAYLDFYSNYEVEPTDPSNTRGYKGRMNHVIKSYREKRLVEKKAWNEANTVDSQANGMSKVPLLVARYASLDGEADKTVLEPAIRTMVRLLQDSVLSEDISVFVGKLCSVFLQSTEQLTPSQLLNQIFVALSSTSTFAGYQFTEFEYRLLSFVMKDDVLIDFIEFVNAINAMPAPTPEENDSMRNWRVRGGLLNHFITKMTSFDLADAVASFSPTMEKDKAFIQEVWSNYSSAKQKVEGDASAKKELLANVQTVGGAIGQSCGLPDAILNVLYLLRVSNSLVEAIHLNNLIGGDNCSRSIVLGALYAASGGESATIPKEWLEKVNMDDIMDKTIDICSKNDALARHK